MLSKITDVIDNPKLKLCVNSKGGLEAKKPYVWEIAQAALGFGPYAPKKVAKYLSEHQDQLYQEVDSMATKGLKIGAVQDTIDVIFTQVDAGMVKPDLMAHVYSSWMGCLSEEKKSAPFLKSVFLPGTHDSGAYNIEWLQKLTSGPDALRTASKILGYIPIINDIVEDWTVTQNKTVTQQLNHGIRLFDLRVAYDEDHSSFYLAHTFALGGLEACLKEFARFIDQHPSEMIVINIKPDYPHRDAVYAHEEELGALLDSYLGEMMVERDHQDISLNEAVANHKNIILSYNGSQTVIGKNIWTSDDAKEFWNNASNVADKIELLNQGAPYAGTAISYTNACVTPNYKTIITACSLYDVSQEMNGRLYDLLQTSPATLKDNNIGLIMDFPNNELVEEIISLNHIEE